MKRLRVPAFGKQSKRLQQHGDQVSAASHGGAGWWSGGLCPFSQAERTPSAPVPRYKNKLRSLNVESVFTVLKSRHGVSGTSIKIEDWK